MMAMLGINSLILCAFLDISKLWKLRGFMDLLLAKFQDLYEVNGFVTVDESMVKFKGRLAWQYLPMKPVKWGVKVWVMAESKTGYVNNFQVYTG